MDLTINLFLPLHVALVGRLIRWPLKLLMVFFVGGRRPKMRGNFWESAEQKLTVLSLYATVSVISFMSSTDYQLH